MTAKPNPLRKRVAFENPANGYVEHTLVFDAFLLSFLFGPLYYAIKSVWTHAAISLAAALLTGGLSWLIYPFFTKRILTTHYLRKGYVERVGYDPKAETKRRKGN